MTALYIALLTIGLLFGVPLILRTRDGEAPSASFGGAAAFFALAFGPVGLLIHQFEVSVVIELLLVFAIAIAIAIVHSDILRAIYRGDPLPGRTETTAAEVPAPIFSPSDAPGHD